jgi:signal transduction histidine kinase
VHHPDHVDRVVAHIRHCFETGTPWEDTFPLRSRTGEYRRFLSRAIPIRDEHGRVARWFGTNTDIEERLRVEEELQRRIAFEEQLIGIVSHDLRNPINAIGVGSQLLLRRDDVGHRNKRTIERIRSSAERATRLVHDLLDFTRERMGKELPL